MLDSEKKQPLMDNEVEFTNEVEINRPAAEVFALIDVADPLFSHAQRGAKITRIDGDDQRYDMTIEAIDEAVFQFTVLERVVGERHALSCVMVPQLFALEKSIETHVIEKLSATACKVTITTKATFDAGLDDDEMANEVAIMNEAILRDSEKLKILAENDLEAVEETERAEMEHDLGFELRFVDGDGIEIDWDDIEPDRHQTR